MKEGKELNFEEGIKKERKQKGKKEKNGVTDRRKELKERRK